MAAAIRLAHSSPGRPATAPRWRLVSPFLEHFSQALFSDQSWYNRGLVEGNPVG
jgi:hypothetical protein